jgi:hypothetical protein
MLHELFKSGFVKYHALSKPVSQDWYGVTKKNGNFWKPQQKLKKKKKKKYWQKLNHYNLPFKRQ